MVLKSWQVLGLSTILSRVSTRKLEIFYQNIYGEWEFTILVTLVEIANIENNPGATKTIVPEEGLVRMSLKVPFGPEMLWHTNFISVICLVILCIH